MSSLSVFWSQIRERSYLFRTPPKGDCTFHTEIDLNSFK